MTQFHSNSPEDIDPAAASDLCDDDATVFDALLAAKRGEPVAPLSPALAQHAAKMAALLELMAKDPIEPAPDDLTQRTLANIEHDTQRQRFTRQIQMLTEVQPSFIGGAWRQGLAVAAILIVSLSLMAPVISRTRADAQRVACAGNLATAGTAFGAYAADFAGVLPRGMVKPGAVWWDVGRPNHTQPQGDEIVHSNSAHLYLLIREGYVRSRDLACPSNPYAHPHRRRASQRDWPNAPAVSYSYQNQYTHRPIRIRLHPNMALLADKNPLFVVRVGQMTYDSRASRKTPSRFHHSRGQNVLLSDGSVRWTIHPMIERRGVGTDNIWVLPNVTHYTGRETPARDDGRIIDNFLVP